MSTEPDGELVRLALEGDPAAIGELFSRYWRAARAAAAGVTGDFASAEDAAAEAFQQALAGLVSLKEPNLFGPWLRTIVLRRARLESHWRRRSTAVPNSEPPDGNERADAALERLERNAGVQEAVRGLNDHSREAMMLVYFEGYEPEAAARFLEIPPGTLRRRLHDGRKQIRIQLLGGKRMSTERERQRRRIEDLIDNGEVYDGLREALTLRPPVADLADLLLQGTTQGKTLGETARDMAQQFLRPSEHVSEPGHPVTELVASIRGLLPEFKEWSPDAGAAAPAFFNVKGGHAAALRALLPPGFAQGQPGAFLRTTRALMNQAESGQVRSIYQVLQDSPSEQHFRASMADIQVSDVIDLTWMVAAPLELKAVHDLLERLASATLSQRQLRFSMYGEPRYRSALQLQPADNSTRLAHGGVLAAWPGRVEGVDAAHVRIFLEPWAAAQSIATRS